MTCYRRRPGFPGAPAFEEVSDDEASHIDDPFHAQILKVLDAAKVNGT